MKAAITAVVRKCGGDEKTGGDLLDPPRTIRLGPHPATLRVPTGSVAGKLDDDELGAFITDTYFRYDFAPERGAARVILAMTPCFDDDESM